MTRVTKKVMRYFVPAKSIMDVSVSEVKYKGNETQLTDTDNNIGLEGHAYLLQNGGDIPPQQLPESLRPLCGQLPCPPEGGGGEGAPLPGWRSHGQLHLPMAGGRLPAAPTFTTKGRLLAAPTSTTREKSWAGLESD
ncbi:UNVERIFIED_CONTAM: hypothetical protein FKN15_002589 [Acipenser sinensis]